MKKLIIVLTVVSMAALLFTGCLPTPNTPPVITYNPSQTATKGIEFISTVTATDAEGDTLIFSVSGGPTDMVIDSATGVISGWTPAAAGTETVLVAVTDGKDPSTLLVTITVTEPVVPELDITIDVAGEYLETATNKTYVRGGSREITVTFPAAITDIPVIKVGTDEVPVFSTDDKVWLGSHTFTGDSAKLITVGGVCDEDICAAKSVVVDSGKPYVELKAEAAECACEDSYVLTIASDWEACVGCDLEPGCCGDKGSGLASWDVQIFDKNPWYVSEDDDCEPCCTEDPCVDPIAELDGTACPITITTECIEPELIFDDGWWHEDYFTRDYFVIATLTDNVGNKTTYMGVVEPVDDEDEDYVAYFAEIYHEADMSDYSTPDTEYCWCYAEPEPYGKILGDCDGTPATECYTAPIPALECPEVIPLTGTVGEEIAIKLTFNRDVVDENVMAFISDAAKDLPSGIPEGALPLFLEQDDVDLTIFTGKVTFETPGRKVLYVLWDCEDCTPCMYEINITPIKACAELAWTGAVDALGDGEDWLKGGETYTFTLTYDHVITDDEQKLYEVRIRDYFDLANLGNIFGDLRTLADMTNTDNKVFTGTFTPPSIEDAGEYCTKAYVEVDILEDCCEPCMYKFNVDAELPYAETKISTEDCCGFAFLEFDSTMIDCDDYCCVDECTSVVNWKIDIYDAQPVWDCCEVTSVPRCTHEGDSCPIDVEMDGCAYCCLPTGTYWIVTSLTDAVGNVKEYYDEVEISGSLGKWLLTDTEYDWICDIVCDGEDSNPFIDGIPGPTEGPAATVIYGDTCGECLAECAVVTFDPDKPFVGELVGILIDFTNAVKPDNPAAFVGPAIKGWPLGIPEDAQELVLTDNGDYTYSATYTFGQAGTDYLYVTDDCEECTPCKYGITVLPVKCPEEVTISDSITFDDMIVIDGGEHKITVEFDAPVDPVRVFVSNALWMEFEYESGGWYEYWWDYWYDYHEHWEFGWFESWYDEWFDEWYWEYEEWYEWMEGSATLHGDLQNVEGIPVNTIEVAMTTTDGKTYTGTIDFGWGNCDERWIYVAYDGDPCCMNICDYQVVVDSESPFVDLRAFVTDEENCGTECDPDWGARVIITSDAFVDDEECIPLCCGDDCLELAEWTMLIFDTQPAIVDGCECVPDPCVDPIKVCEGTGCPVECDVFGCVPWDDWHKIADYEYYVVLEVSDPLGNTRIELGILHTWHYGANINDARIDENCNFYVACEDGLWDVMGPCTFEPCQP